MQSLKISFQHFDSDMYFKDVDIICAEKSHQTGSVIGCSLARIEVVNNDQTYELLVKFEWIDSMQQLNEEDFCLITETNMLFFKSMFQWGVIDITGKCLKNHESAFCCPFIYKHDTFILIEEELEAISFTLSGDVIDRIPIDPPYETQEFED